jgi:hypothetical protein
VAGRLDCWTCPASQKARNLERDPRATLLTEAGTAYQELRGVSLECDAELVRDPDQVLDFGVALAVGHGAHPSPDPRAGLGPPGGQAGRRPLPPDLGLELGSPQGRLTEGAASQPQPRRDEAIAAATLGRARPQVAAAANRVSARR